MERALIVGPGPMGMLMGLALQSHGVEQVAFRDISEDRLELVVRFGFDAIVIGADELRQWHQSADLAVDATGNPSVATGLTDYIANGGKGLFFGVCPSEARIEILPFEVFRRQLTLPDHIR